MKLNEIIENVRTATKTEDANEDTFEESLNEQISAMSTKQLFEVVDEAKLLEYEPDPDNVIDMTLRGILYSIIWTKVSEADL